MESRPIFLIGVPLVYAVGHEPIQAMEKNIPQAIKDNYHVLFYTYAGDSLKFETLNAKDASDIDLEDFRKLLLK